MTVSLSKQSIHPISDACCKGCGGPLPPSSRKPRKWCSERCRKRSYGDPCVDCGAKTRYGAETARIPEPRCPTCATEHYRQWTREKCIAAIRHWAREHGEPPAVCDWDHYQAANALHDYERAQRAGEGVGNQWPHPNTIRRLFGSWPAGLIAAGFEARAPHGGGGNELRQRARRERAAA